ncbi:MULTISPECIES: S1C family serine protease [unclassified Streptomyces]|uniref:S1C family serine protease n=1 Tax=unclassified Streptomyces TaxID=2593676 RepID=UPI0005EC9C28|nr:MULTISPECIES: trypsin-like peptidase domain-containing protein [unclassified Streptomyces]APU40934.1 serine protease [Streptomyces sp. TN58]KJK46535.1 serine protease [Streptomyces sp. NRRL F-4428]
MTESFRREGEYPQEHRPQHAPFGEDWQRGRDRLAHEAGAGTWAGAYPPPPSYPPAAPGWHEAHQPPVIRGETVPAAAGGEGGGAEGAGLPQGPAHAAPDRRAKKPVALLAAVALVAALVGGGTAAAVQQLLDRQGGTAGGVSGTNVSQSSTGTVAGIAEQVSPSVVRIDTRTGSGQGTGSGFVLTADGEIATNNHVVDGATEIQVTTSDGRKYQARIVGTDPDKDLALIKLQDASGLKPARLGDSGSVKVGDQVVAIGSPDGLTGTVTSGIVSALEREVKVPKSEQSSPQSRQRGGDSWPFSFGGRQFNGDTGSNTTSYKALQTDASLNPGNSGGALLNMNGEVVGMPSAIYSPASAGSAAGSVGLGFAIPVDTIKADLDSLRKGGPGGKGSGGDSRTSGGDSFANGFGTSF